MTLNRQRLFPHAAVMILWALPFSASRADIDLEAHDPPEFCDWKWVDPDQLPELIVPFKKRVYRAVVEAFREIV